MGRYLCRLEFYLSLAFSEESSDRDRRPRRFSDLLLPVAKTLPGPTNNNNQPESPGSLLSHQTAPGPGPSSASASKPPIFSSPDVKNSAFKFNLKLKTSEPTFVLRRETVSATEALPASSSSSTEFPSLSRELDKVKRRRSFNPNEAAPPRPSDLTRPHSVYRMENQNNNRVRDPQEINNRTEAERRKSDFLSRYEELTCKAALAIKSVDQIVGSQDRNNENNRNEANIHPLLDSPLTPDVESVEFNEEEVLKTCQDFLDDYDRSKTRAPGPVPAPRLSLTNRVVFPSSSRHRPASQLSREDEELLAAAQEKSFWEPSKHQAEASSVFERLENVNPEAFDSKIIRTRSSSLTIHDKSEEKIKPILKKSTEDLAEHNKFPSILKTRDDFGLNSKTKHEGKYEHVRIRSPSPDFENETIDLCDEDGRSSSPEVPSILKARFRRTSVDGISFDDLNDGEPQSILKRKSSFGSGSHSPEGNSENTRSILKKSSRNSSRTCSRSGSIEELDVESTKSILKSRNSSRTCSRSGSQEELDLDFDDEWETRPKSILKKKSGSTDDELDERPKSILKSRRSEESLSPHSDLVETPSHSILRDGRSSSGTRQSSIISDTDEVLVISGRSSPQPLEETVRRPILKNREDISAPHSILKKQREKSSSPPPVGPRLSSPDLGLHRPEPRRLGRSHPRHLTQPVTHQEVTQAAELNNSQQSNHLNISSVIERVRMFEATATASSSISPISPSTPLTSLPPPSSASTCLPAVSRRGRRKANSARFQTQPITVDEVEMARTRRGGEGSGASSPEASLRPNQFLHSFSVDSPAPSVTSAASGK